LRPTTARLVYALGTRDDQRTLAWVDTEGQAEPIAMPPGAYMYPRLSPDGGRVAIDGRGTGNDIWIWDFQSETRTRFTVGPEGGTYPVWTPDGSRLAFETEEAHIYWKASNNTGTAEPLLERPGRERTQAPSPYFFSPDGTALVYRDAANPETGDDLRMVPVDDPETPVWALADSSNERNASLSPDGRWMAYQAEERGVAQVFVRPFPQVDDDLVQVSSDGGYDPVFSPDGRELYYLSHEGAMTAVSVDVTAGRFGFGERRTLFPFLWLAQVPGRTFDVGPDGRFLVVDPSAGSPDGVTEPRLTVVLHWTEALREQVPVE